MENAAFSHTILFHTIFKRGPWDLANGKAKGSFFLAAQTLQKGKSAVFLFKCNKKSARLVPDWKFASLNKRHQYRLTN